MTRQAIVVPARVSSRERPRGSLFVSGPATKDQPDEIKTGNYSGDRRELPFRANERVGLLIMIERHAQRALLGAFGNGFVSWHYRFGRARLLPSLCCSIKA